LQVKEQALDAMHRGIDAYWMKQQKIGTQLKLSSVGWTCIVLLHLSCELQVQNGAKNLQRLRRRLGGPCQQ